MQSSLMKVIEASRASGMGKYLQSAQSIAANTVLLDERPLVVVRNPMIPSEFGCMKKVPEKLEQIFSLQETPDASIGRSFRLLSSQVAASIVWLSPKHKFYKHYTLAEFLQLSRILMINGYSWRYSDLPFSHALYNYSSLFNHSCRPNCVAEQTTEGLRVSTIKDVPEDEMLTTSYLSFVDLAMPRHVRQKKLAQTKLFKCQCPRCTEELDTTRQFECLCGGGGMVYPVLGEAEAEFKCTKCSKYVVKRKEAGTEKMFERAFRNVWSLPDLHHDAKRTQSLMFCDAVKKAIKDGFFADGHWIAHMSSFVFIRAMRDSDMKDANVKWEVQDKAKSLARWLEDQTETPLEHINKRMLELIPQIGVCTAVAEALQGPAWAMEFEKRRSETLLREQQAIAKLARKGAQSADGQAATGTRKAREVEIKI